MGQQRLLALAAHSATNSTFRAPPAFMRTFRVMSVRDDDLHVRPGRIWHGNQGAQRSKSFVSQVMRAAKKGRPRRREL
jgi:hypothetical protein